MRAAGCGEVQGLMGRDRQLTIATVKAGPTPEEPELLSIPDSTDSAQEFRDRSTGLPLNPAMVKTTAVLGPNSEMSDVQEATHLNRLLRPCAAGAEGGERWELEADPRHVEILISQMGLATKAKQ